MARSTKIYVVATGEPDAELLAAFTVKHELVSWLERNGRQGMFIQSMPDNPRKRWNSETKELEETDGRGDDITDQFKELLA